MPETSVISRRDIPTQYEVNSVEARSTQPSASKERDTYHRDRNEDSEDASLGVMFDIANRLSKGIDPLNQNITYRDFKYLVEINTALFALNVINSGLPLQAMCQYLQNTTVQLYQEENFINAKQASDIICFASVYGLYFNESNQALLSQLALLEYAIQAYTYDSQSLQQICQDLDYAAASFLGIDTDGIRTYVCNNTGPPAHPLVSNTTSAASNTTGSGPTGMTTASSMTASGTVSIVYGTSGSEVSSATSAAGTVTPWWWNSTTSTASETMPWTSGGRRVSPTTNASPPHYYPPMLRRHARAGH